MKLAIELFSGSKTVTKVLKSRGWECISIDNDIRTDPDICCDVRDLPSDLVEKECSFIWASIPCNVFSRAAKQSNWIKTTISYRNYNYTAITVESRNAIEILQHTIEFIKRHTAAKFVIENPIGRLHQTQEMRKLPHYRYAVNYADYGFMYSKETYLFTNFLLPFSSKKVHSYAPGLRTIRNLQQRQKVPAGLIEIIANYL